MSRPPKPEKFCPNCSLLHTRWGETCRERLMAETRRLRDALAATDPALDVCQRWTAQIAHLKAGMLALAERWKESPRSRALAHELLAEWDRLALEDASTALAALASPPPGSAAPDDASERLARCHHDDHTLPSLPAGSAAREDGAPFRATVHVPMSCADCGKDNCSLPTDEHPRPAPPMECLRCKRDYMEIADPTAYRLCPSCLATAPGAAPATAADGCACVSCGHGEDKHNSPIANGCCEGEWKRCGCRRFSAPASPPSSVDAPGGER